MKTYQLYVVPIGNEKITENIGFHPKSLVLKYHPESSKSCCLSSLESAFHRIVKNRSVTDLANCIEESLILQ